MARKTKKTNGVVEGYTSPNSLWVSDIVQLSATLPNWSKCNLWETVKNIFNFPSSLELSKTLRFVSVVNAASTKNHPTMIPAFLSRLCLAKGFSFHPHQTSIFFGLPYNTNLSITMFWSFPPSRFSNCKKDPPSLRFSISRAFFVCLVGNCRKSKS